MGSHNPAVLLAAWSRVESALMRPLLLGHRGACGVRSIGENTFAAFDLAFQHGCDGFEFDVRATADEALVVCHDPRFKRKVIAETAAAEFAELPKLEAVLQKYAERAFLDVELKVPGIESRVLKALAKYPPRRGFVVSSFLPEVLLQLRRLNLSVPLGLIFNKKSQLSIWKSLPLDYLFPHHSLLKKQWMDEAHDAGEKVVTWTVNRRQNMLQFAGWGVDGIISDKPELLVSTLRSPGRDS